jgi:excinuclease ABC subunit B
MIREFATAPALENLRLLDGPAEGSRPDAARLIPADFLLYDESHRSEPQVRGMFFGDRNASRRWWIRLPLPSALDNRPLTFDVFGSG